MAAAVSTLEVSQLGLRLGQREVLSNVSFSLKSGDSVALVGESGSGKTMTALAIARLLPPQAQFSATSSIRLDHTELLALPEHHMRRLRGRRLGMVFQEPSLALNPIMSVQKQLLEVLALHHPGQSRSQLLERAKHWLDQVGLNQPEQLLGRYPFELSGGMRQRLMLALALCAEPDWLLLDEPTTALDVSLQQGVLNLLLRLKDQLKLSLLWVTHDLSVVAHVAERVLLMCGGRVVADNSVAEFFARPRHPYAHELFKALPGWHRRGSRLVDLPTSYERNPQGCAFASRCSQALSACFSTAPQLEHGLACFAPLEHTLALSSHEAPQASAQSAETSDEALLRVEQLEAGFKVGRYFSRRYRAVLKPISFELKKGRTLAVVGESGSGKTTLARALLRLIPAHSGQVWIGQQPWLQLPPPQLRQARAQAQIVFQDPYSAFDPRMTVAQLLAEPSLAQGRQLQQQPTSATELLQQVGLDPSMAERYPHEFSGGQRQRLAIARALALQPSLLVLDEPTSALDVLAQAHILEQLRQLQQQRPLAYLLITHNLALVAYLADQVLVMYAGAVVESAPVGQLLSQPQHPYTQHLLARQLPLAPRQSALTPREPEPAAPATDGCAYQNRCPLVMDTCRHNRPALQPATNHSQVACWHRQ